MISNDGPKTRSKKKEREALQEFGTKRKKLF
jgi:hypothetical protein